MRLSSHYPILLMVLMTLAGASAHAVDEQAWIAVLQSGAGAAEQTTACRRLRIHGTADAVPALSALLTRERVGHAARDALEAMPCSEASAALRQALGQTTGPIQAGIASSIGWRGDSAAVPLLAPLLAGRDQVVAAAAATALGRIGGPDATSRLRAALPVAGPSLRPAVADALLHRAESRLRSGDGAGAAALYRELFATHSTPAIRIASWRGEGLSDVDAGAGRVVDALRGTDSSLHQAALSILRELTDARAVLACVSAWDDLPPTAQLAVLEAQIRLGIETRSAIRRAVTSPLAPVRIGAWRALATSDDHSLIPALARAAAHGESVEREAARDTLTRLQSPGTEESLQAHLARAEPAVAAELIRALGERADPASAAVLLEQAVSGDAVVRSAALQALARLAAPQTLPPLLELAAASTSEAERADALRAVHAVCREHPDLAGSRLVAHISHASHPERKSLLPLLGELASPEALAVLQETARQPDVALTREAIRVMGLWPTAATAPFLLELAHSAPTLSLRMLAVRSGLATIRLEPDPDARLALVHQALSMAVSTQELKTALGLLGQIPQPQALALARPYLENPEVVNEAAAAVLSLIETLAPEHVQEAADISRQVLAGTTVPALVTRARAVQIRNGGEGPFIRHWQVSGPYRQAGVVGATALFPLAFGPERESDHVTWYAVPAGDVVNLSALFPGQEHCLAYLQTLIIAPEATEALLLMGSDDGIGVWLNDQAVFTNNIDRGMVPDEDLVSIQLRQGANRFLLKISQGGGGWSACARILGPDARPIPGLHAVPQDGSAPPPP